MPGSHGEITVDDQNRVDNDHKTTSKKKKKKKEEEDDGIETENQLLMPSISKPRKRFIDKFRKRPKSSSSSSSTRSGLCKGGCFSLRRRRRTEEEEEEGSPSSPVSDPNDECFTHEMLRVMLETNGFFSDDCNPHRWESLRKSKKYENLVRWFDSILLDYAEPLNKVATYTTTMKKGSGKPAAPRPKDQEGALKPDRKVRLRFAPEPSGYRYMGHKAALLKNSFSGALIRYFGERYYKFQRSYLRRKNIAYEEEGKLWAGRNTGFKKGG